MRQLAIISGKGGCGKTTLTAAFSSLSENAVLADCDVDASDLPLILKPRILNTEDCLGMELAYIDPECCTGCGTCREICRFGAVLENFTINPYGCEGCAVCTVACPEKAVYLMPRVSGQAVSSITRFGPMAHAKLGTGEEASGKLVTLVRKKAVELADQYSSKLILIDGPPGTGCPVMAAITGTDLILVLSEPTVSGLHDLKRAIELTAHFRIPAVACINRYDINEKKSLEIEAFCREAGIPLLARLPYTDITTEAMMNEETVIEYAAHSREAEAVEFANIIRKLWADLKMRLSGLCDKEICSKTLPMRES
ncbi:Heterodisulfide reductase subunit A-like protein [Methanosarcina siciliae T4/M]|uniref:Heterodisulfide reductase subunit A-like protein n=2 Tax=Methanosarcina siciliae TaxID=38027 RepID=A0A0E3PHS0_9EURY|nr:ATP-binding protein [Methanosarcina siciliae]AKB30165.1 Heterodisulfide reductase subunit A-like protein [Methanosarcina siciliae T4/M]AKB34067.1 Heterodisulfide reductase subunit A-like protein [Methanosarcina siciliae HI350]